MNTLKVEAKLAQKYGYRPLPADLAEKYHGWYIENMPAFLRLEGSNTALYTMSGTKLCDSYDRVVVGDYGAFVEFSEPSSEFVIQKGQEYRVYDERYSTKVKYVWLTAKDNSGIKIYRQNRTVTYADYKPNKYYVSVHEVKTQ